MSKILMAIDQGTTGTTVLLLDEALNVKGKVNREFPQIFPQPGWVEHDPEAIWSSTEQAITQALGESGCSGTDIAAIGITNQRETTIVWSRQDGRPIHNAIVWQCRRTAPHCEALRQQGLEALFRERTGLVLDAYFSGTKVTWLLDNVEGARARAEAGDLVFGTIDTFLLWRLTAGRVHATEVSNASRTLLMNLKTGKWDETLCEALNVPMSMLPEIYPTAGFFGETGGLSSLPDGIPITGIAGDQQAALAALNAILSVNPKFSEAKLMRLQIAGGDEVHPTKAWHQPDVQDYIPAGFLRLAPWDLGNLQAYELRQAYLDEVTGVTASVFLGLTLECARCHDHKYDEIPARDYYRFQAFFNAIQIPLPPNTSSEAPEFVDVPYANEGVRRRAEARITSYEKRLAEEDLQDDEAALLRRRISRWETSVATVQNVAGPPLGPDIAPIRLLLGGDFRNRGEALEPGFPSLLTGHSQPAKLQIDRYGQYPTRGRRTTLARWIASPDNPLTARVMVNRIWEYHFGRGIVETPNNFGVNGRPPTHPELLDWLAVDFVQHGWSLKSMHRRLVTSATYGQSSDNRAVDESLDPENKLLWRFRRRRLEAEAIRDSLLAISGRLSLLRYGPGVFPSLPPGMDELRKPVRQYSAAWDANETAEDACRRSIYTFQQRSLPSPLMASFDAQVVNKSCPRRSVTTTPLQALSMMNGTLVSQSAAALARRIEREAGPETRDQIVRLFEIVLSRPPAPDELARFSGFDGSLTRLARVMLSSNAFLYVD